MWFDAVGFEGRLQVTKCGLVRSVDRYVPNYPRGRRFLKGRILSGSVAKNGYIYISLVSKAKSGNKGRNVQLHRIIANTFIDNPNHLDTVNHIDGNKLNNNVSNLEWMSSSDNVRHAWGLGLSDHTKKPVAAIKGDEVICFESIQSTKDSGFTPSLVHAALNGKQRTHKGYKWEYREIMERQNG